MALIQIISKYHMNKLLENKFRNCLGNTYSLTPEWEKMTALVSQTYDNFSMHEGHLASLQRIAGVEIGNWTLIPATGWN